MKTELMVIDVNLYDELKEDINFIKNAIAHLQKYFGRPTNSVDEWLTPLQTQQLLGIGRTKYFEMKSEGLFVFCQFGRTAKISRKSLDAFLQKKIVK